MAKIKILHFSDVHGSRDKLEQLKNYANKKTDLNLIVCSGDILGQCLSGPQVKDMYTDLETITENYGKNIENSKDFENAIMKGIKSSDDRIKAAIAGYLHIQKRFEEISLKRYNEFKEQIKGFKEQVMTIPGNWDTPWNYIDILKNHNLHGSIGEFKGLKIAGYGGADSVPYYVPQFFNIPYSESEFAEFLKQAKPEVVISHMPPKGILDGEEKIGSTSLEEYVRKKQPKLVLCGHEHKAGYTKVGKTTIVNSGNLGRYFNQKTYGNFSEIEIDGDKITVTQYWLDDNGNAQKIK